MPVVAITDALAAIAQLIQLVQAAHASGAGSIPKADFDAAVAARNQVLGQLDTDIAAAKARGQ